MKMDKYDINIKKTIKYHRDLAFIILEDAEELYEGGKDQYQKCIELCEFLSHIRMTHIKNGLPMPKWYSLIEERLRVMYKWYADFKAIGKTKYSLNHW